MSSYAYFVQTCREEHKKKHPDASVNFSEFSKKCSERWKVKNKSAMFYYFFSSSKFIILLQVAFIFKKYFLFYFFQRLCHQKRRASLKIWLNKTRCAMRGKWRIMCPLRVRRRSDLRTLMLPRDRRKYHNFKSLWGCLFHFTLHHKLLNGRLNCNILSPQVCFLYFLCWLSAQGKGWESRPFHRGHRKEAWRDVEQLICRRKAAVWKEGFQVEGEVRQSEWIFAKNLLTLIRRFLGSVEQLWTKTSRALCRISWRTAQRAK